MTAMTDLAAMMRKVDAFHEPSEANALLTEGAKEIERLRALLKREWPLPGGHWHPGDQA
jgi:hypothetical protein